jgi:hypothetical protein
MAVRLSVTVDKAQMAAFRATLSRLQVPKLNIALKSFLLTAGYAVLNNAVEHQIIRQGRIRILGPRGGRGKLVNSDVDPRRLTNRHGGHGLVGSLSQNRGTDRSGLPRYIDVGSDKKYAPVHEYGLGHYPPRPFLKPALAAVEPRFQSMLGDVIDKAIEGSTI